jgi:hypothetical protein
MVRAIVIVFAAVCVRVCREGRHGQGSKSGDDEQLHGNYPPCDCGFTSLSGGTGMNASDAVHGFLLV